MRWRDVEESKLNSKQSPGAGTWDSRSTAEVGRRLGRSCRRPAWWCLLTKSSFALPAAREGIVGGKGPTERLTQGP